MSILMAIADFIPVIFFTAGSILLQRDFYNKMVKGMFSLFSAGTMFVVFAGTYKAVWKLLYNAGICDFAVLNRCFFPMQATGFFLAAMGVAAVQVHKCHLKKEAKIAEAEKRVKVNSFAPAPLAAVTLLTAKAAPAEYSGTFILVAVMVIGVFVLDAALFQVCIQRKQPGAAAMIVFSFIFVLGMGYLSSKDFEKDAMNWIAEGVNTLGQGLYFFVALTLHRKGLGAKDALGYSISTVD